MATHSSILPWKIPWTEEVWWAAVHGVAKSGTCLFVHEHARSDTHAQPDADSLFHQHALGVSLCTLSSPFSLSGSLLRAVNSLLQDPG